MHGNMDDSTEGHPTTQEDDNFAQFQEVETDTKRGARGCRPRQLCLVIVTSTVLLPTTAAARAFDSRRPSQARPGRCGTLGQSPCF